MVGALCAVMCLPMNSNIIISFRLAPTTQTSATNLRDPLHGLQFDDIAENLRGRTASSLSNAHSRPSEVGRRISSTEHAVACMTWSACPSSEANMMRSSSRLVVLADETSDATIDVMTVC